MGPTLECTWEEFKHRFKEFNDAAPTLTYDELDNAFKAIGLSYLGMNEPVWLGSAVILLEMAALRYVECASLLAA